MKLSGQHLIAGEQSITNKTGFQAVNPSSGSTLPTTFREASNQEVDSAVQAGAKAFDSYRKTLPEQRAAFLEAIADEIMALGNVLIQRTQAETGLPEGRLTGERGRTVGQLRLFASVVRDGHWLDARIDTANSERTPVPKPDVRSQMQALGPVAVFGASNFPLAFSTAGGDTASALAAGCPVVVKAHPAHPGASELVGRAIQVAAKKCDMPSGVFALLQGSSHAAGTALVQHAGIKAVGFTGSLRGGKALYDLAVRRAEPIPVYAEMGSSNPVFVLPGALAARGEAIAAGLANSVTLGAGQFCTNPGLVFGMRDAEFAAFQGAAAAAIGEKSADTMLTQAIQQNYDASAEGLAARHQLQRLAAGAAAKGCTGQPQLFAAGADQYLADAGLQEEVFGPASILVACDDREQLIQIAEGLHGHLTATIHAEQDELSDYAELITVLEKKVGRLILNGFPTGVEVCHAMVHGGPFPATTDAATTSVGTMAIRRFLRPVCYQDFPDGMRPPALQDANPLGIWRLVDGEMRKDAIE